MRQISVLRTDEGLHRLHDTLHATVLMCASLLFSMICLERKSLLDSERVMTSISNFRHIAVRFTTLHPLQLAVSRLPPRFIEVALFELNDEERKKPLNLNHSFGSIITSVMSGLFVRYYESHQQWIRDRQTTHLDWPPSLAFGRVIRNAVAHGGRVAESSDRTVVSWHGMTLSKRDNGTPVIGNAGLGPIADLLLLMFDMSRELDQLGCPHDLMS